MEKKGVLEELSYSLPEKERLNLLDRINKSLEFETDDAQQQSASRKNRSESYISMNS